ASLHTDGCTPGEVLGCAQDALSFCNELGELEEVACSGGCTRDRCREPAVTSCADPIQLHDGASVDGALAGENHIELAGGQIGRCQLGSAGPTSGAEDIYRVDLEAGELLTLEINSESSALRPFIAESCHNPAETCQAVDANGKDGLL